MSKDETGYGKTFDHSTNYIIPHLRCGFQTLFLSWRRDEPPKNAKCGITAEYCNLVGELNVIGGGRASLSQRGQPTQRLKQYCQHSPVFDRSLAALRRSSRASTGSKADCAAVQFGINSFSVDFRRLDSRSLGRLS